MCICEKHLLASLTYEREIGTDQQALGSIQYIPWDYHAVLGQQSEEAIHREEISIGTKTGRKTGR